MTKTEFLNKLSLELQHKNVSDIADIMKEYEEHFAFKLLDGYSEEEIAAKLGDPKAIAEQYDTVVIEKNNGNKTMTIVNLCVVDFFFGILCVLLYSFEIIIAALAIICGTVAVVLLANISTSILTFIPIMPYNCAIILGFVFTALTVLFVIGAIYFFAFIRQLIRSYSRFHKNTLAFVSAKAVLPRVSVCPQFTAKTKHVLKRLSLLAFVVFSICFIVGFIICVYEAGAIEFWHSWSWFGYVK